MKTFNLLLGTRGAFLVAIVTALIMGVASQVAAQMKKEGTFSGTYAGYGTCKNMAVGKERLLFVCEENGFAITDGFLDHTTLHCWVFGDFAKGMGAPHGTCVGTDPTGDQIYWDFVLERNALDVKSARGTITLMGGTGKYAGISGEFPYENDYGAFRTAVEGTYASRIAAFQGSYKLP
jgi:hypothetical protein